jgi:putative transposase
VSTSGYYSWKRRPVSARQQANDDLLPQIRQVHQESREVYGSPRVTAALKAQGVSGSEKRVARLMRKAGIRAKTAVARHPVTTDSGHGFPVAENLLNRDFVAAAPNQKWVGDISYLPSAQGWLYLAVVIDLYSRQVVGWALDEHMEASLAVRALQMALQQRQPSAGLVFHSDRGSQYAAGEYQQLLKQYGVVASMSRRGNCWDNAVSESFFHTFKEEYLAFHPLNNLVEARSSLFDYIEIFYNRKRLHSAIGYLSPMAFEKAAQAADPPLPTNSVH